MAYLGLRGQQTYDKKKISIAKNKFTYLANGTDSTSVPESGTAERDPAVVEDDIEKGGSWV